MAEDSQSKTVKVGVKEGGGPPPGYRWNVDILDQSHDEAVTFLAPDQYQHMVAQVKELARQDDLSHSQTIDIRPVEDFYEIRDKGGILRKLNVRVFFFVHKPSRTMVILGTIKKENDGPTPVGDKSLMRRRKRLYLEKYHSKP